MTDSTMGKPVEILLVEDNPGDVRLAQEALKECKMKNKVRSVTDGVAALQYLQRQGPYAGESRPDLILLDLNLPKMDGREVLGQIKSDPQLRRIPVVILTTSKSEEDIIRTYDLHANCYITKPIDMDQFISVVKKIEDFWFTIVKLPAE